MIRGLVLGADRFDGVHLLAGWGAWSGSEDTDVGENVGPM
jgi:hypothetical protein